MRHQFINHTRTLLWGCDGDYDKEYGFKFRNEAAYTNFVSRPRNPELEELRAAGIDYGYHSERIVTPGFGFSYAHPFTGLTIEHRNHYYLRVYNADKFFKKTSPVDLEKKQERAQRQTFLTGMESKTSSLNAFNRSGIYDKNTTKLIFQFHSTLQKKSIFHVQPCKSEKPTDVMAINKLMNMIEQLKFEIQDEEDALKKDKVAFLEFVLALRRANTHFGLRDCLSIAKQMQPALYNQAILGFFSRTRKVFDEIETKRCRVSL